MKNKCNVPLVRLFGIAAIVAVIGFSMAACDEPTDDPEYVHTTEQREATTAGRLTITGLSDFNGKKVYANGGIVLGEDNIIPLAAYQTAYNQYNYINGNLESSFRGETVNGTIASGQVTLKVFILLTNAADYTYEEYTGNDQNVEFMVSPVDNEGNNIVDNEGNTVWKAGLKVNFTNGIGTVAFN
ncbi:MAG: hypothetical protein LBB89_04085 [Treponema sp.]|jgi:hypothetical protein|nr:hypothetical protein [Treponema sp.]